MLADLEKTVSAYFAERWKAANSGAPRTADEAISFLPELFEVYCLGLKGIESWSQSSTLEFLQEELADKRRKVENFMQHIEQSGLEISGIQARLKDNIDEVARASVELELEKLQNIHRKQTLKKESLEQQIGARQKELGELGSIRGISDYYFSHAKTRSAALPGFSFPFHAGNNGFQAPETPLFATDLYRERYFLLIKSRFPDIDEPASNTGQTKVDWGRRITLRNAALVVGIALPLGFIAPKVKTYLFPEQLEPLEFRLFDEYGKGGRFFTVAMSKRFKLAAVSLQELEQIRYDYKKSMLSGIKEMTKEIKILEAIIENNLEQERRKFMEYGNRGCQGLVLKDTLTTQNFSIGAFLGERRLHIRSLIADHQLRLYSKKRMFYVEDIGVALNKGKLFDVAVDNDTVIVKKTPLGHEWLTGYYSLAAHLKSDNPQAMPKGLTIPSRNDASYAARFQLFGNWLRYLEKGQLTLDIEGMARGPDGRTYLLPVMAGERVSRR